MILFHTIENVKHQNINYRGWDRRGSVSGIANTNNVGKAIFTPPILYASDTHAHTHTHTHTHNLVGCMYIFVCIDICYLGTYENLEDESNHSLPS